MDYWHGILSIQHGNRTFTAAAVLSLMLLLLLVLLHAYACACKLKPSELLFCLSISAVDVPMDRRRKVRTPPWNAEAGTSCRKASTCIAIKLTLVKGIKTLTFVLWQLMRGCRCCSD